MIDIYERAKRDDEAWEREHDTREKLERDARVIADNWRTYGGKSTFDAHDIIALLDRQAAITERETKLRELYRFEENHREHVRSIEEVNQQLNERIAELQAKVDELNAQNTRLNEKWAEANVQVEKLQAELGSEPFCEQVKRWLNGDAPKECRECGDGCYGRLHAIFARECDSCEPMKDAAAKVDELQTALNRTAGKWAKANARVRELEAELDALRPKRTVEDVLRDVVTLCANTWKDGESPFAFYGVSDVMESGNIKGYADELRELMGGAE